MVIRISKNWPDTPRRSLRGIFVGGLLLPSQEKSIHSTKAEKMSEHEEGKSMHHG